MPALHLSRGYFLLQNGCTYVIFYFMPLLDPIEEVMKPAQFLPHSPRARAELPEAMLAVASLLNIRVIVYYRSEVARSSFIGFVRRPRGVADGPSVIAYVHCEVDPHWVPNEAAWLELFSQLWPGY